MKISKRHYVNNKTRFTDTDICINHNNNKTENLKKIKVVIPGKLLDAEAKLVYYVKAGI